MTTRIDSKIHLRIVRGLPWLLLAVGMIQTVHARLADVAWAQIGAGAFPTCAVTMTDGMKCQRFNEYGRDGNATIAARHAPVNAFGSSAGVAAVGEFAPELQCEWPGPPSEDAFPDHHNVLGTPMVADFDFDDDRSKLRPSIVFPSYDGDDGGGEACIGNATSFGIIRVIDGTDCHQQYTVSTSPHTVAATPVALGDLDGAGDGRPEIVAHRVGGGLVAFRYDPGADAFVVYWQSESTLGAGTCLFSGPSIHDLDNDGVPEVLMGGTVFEGRTGAVIDDSLGLSSVNTGRIPVVADLDADGRPDFVTGDAIFAWDPEANSDGAWSVVASNQGQQGTTALGDFGTFGDTPMVDDRATLDGIPEIATISSGKAWLQTLSGRAVFGPVTLLTSAGSPGNGGPPVVADFDGDGRAEFALAGRGAYNVLDPDCTGTTPDPGTCAGGTANGILWWSPAQDFSSSVTGSAAFDFEGDGRAEVVYADECFARIYDGRTGDVLASQARSSCTFYDNPIIADVDGDFGGELVIPSNTNCNITCPAIDPLFAGLRCHDDTGCPGTSHCAMASGSDSFGLCRCTADADCGGNGYACLDPITGDPPAGKVCRTVHPAQPIHGVRVFRDALDRWADSRPIWNQHAYAVTNVNADGSIPKTSDWKENWLVPGLNSFRQNAADDDTIFANGFE